MTHIVIIDAQFYHDIAEELVRGASYVLENHDMTFERLSVPGAFELPAAVNLARQTGKYDGYIALGCVIRGETSHYDHVCQESIRGLNELALKHNLAIGNGILTVENKDQAWARARETEGNKGATAAYTCMKMIQLKEQLGIKT